MRRSSAVANSPESRKEHLAHAVTHAAHLLPAQGPIGVFIHHNTLHAFQHLPFEQAVVNASRLYGTEPYMKENAYRAQLEAGRIRDEDIDWVFGREPGGAERNRLRRMMLLPGIRRFETNTVEWLLTETDLLTRFRQDLDPKTRTRLIAEGWPYAIKYGAPKPTDDAGRESHAVHALFSVCFQRIPGNAPSDDASTPERRTDIDELIHPFLIRLSAVFLDQGMAYWPMPDREHGFLNAVRTLLGRPLVLYPKCLDGLGDEFRRQNGADSTTVAIQMLGRLGIAEEEWESFVQAELLALPGWAGLMRRLEEEPELAPHERVPCSLTDFLAVRLTMVAVACANVPKEPEAARRDRPELEHLTSAVRLFDVAQLLGLSAPQLAAMDSTALWKLRHEMADFTDFERRRIFHLAYERRHELLILGPLGKHCSKPHPKPAKRPAAQVFFCIDEREESMRRHLEEIDPGVETLSAAGFYGAAIDYTGIDDAHGVALCPVVVKPQHAILEKPASNNEHILQRRRERRRLWSRMAFGTYVASRTLVRGWLSTAALGGLSLFPLVTRVLAPRRYAQLREALNRGFLPEPRTELAFMRTDAEGSAAPGGLLLGFTIREKVDRVAGVLGTAGLRNGFARIVVTLGHGSNSLNNPHESAHDCGACGGRRGGPNGRLFAAMANQPQVRAGLRERGIDIPDDTWFVGGYHDTCHDGIDLYDLDVLPESHRQDLERIEASLDKARAWDAHERTRRFEAANPRATPDQALRHVEERAEHLAEPRPEYGHCTNATCIIGRRSTTRGLYLDRRAFLISYDATQDPEDKSLAGLLGAAGPVCAGISLEYYFSFVDNEGYGCGTKLPHNVTGLVGVMNGASSDLRTGLPWQMVELHEPVRILFVIETTPERVMRAFSTSALLMELLEKRWIRIATLDPETGVIHVYRDGTFERADEQKQALPSVADSVEWYGGKMEHLPIALVKKGIARS